jgi:hypothetical protein
MALSTFRLRWLVLATTFKATLSHFLTRKYPSDWSLTFHIQFAILKKLKEVMLDWTMEEVPHPLSLTRASGAINNSGPNIFR